MISSLVNRIEKHFAADAFMVQAKHLTAMSLNNEEPQYSGCSKELIRCLKAVPEIRPEMVQKAYLLAEDPAYPPIEVIYGISKMIMSSKDPSEDKV